MKMIDKISNIIRIVLTLILIYIVYKETGWWTSFSLFLIFLSIESSSYNQKKLIEKYEMIEKKMKG